MGQFLCIGLVTKMTVSKTKLLQANTTAAELLEAIESKGYSRQIYDESADDSVITLDLKQEVLAAELLPFLEKFFPLLYNEDDSTDWPDACETLRSSDPATWNEIAKKQTYYCFQEDRYADYEWIRCKKSPNHRIPIHCDCIILSLEGKIAMEEYGCQFSFFKLCMREMLREFAIAAALRVYITG